MSTCDCGHPLWAPTSIARGVCEHCHLYRQPAGLRALPYRFSAGYAPPDRLGSPDE
jgi:hypothetical protein